MEYLKSLASCFMILFTIIDIIGNIPIIINFKTRGSFIDSKKIIIVSLSIFSLFLFLGKFVLDFIGIDVNSFSIAGSIILFIISLELILGLDIHNSNNEEIKPSIVPIAFPLIAGPGSLTAIISLKSNYSIEVIIIALLLNMIIAYIVIEKCDFIGKVIGPDGLNVLKKVFGIILLSFSMKLFIGNVYQLFKSFEILV